jgi:hypothetical protein
MSIIATPGFPQQSGILIPEIWSGKLLTKFYAATVLAAISNTEYDGDIKGQGDKVWIRTTPDIAIKKYFKGQNLDIQRPTPNKINMTIDQANYWNFVVDDIDKFQSDINFFEDWTRDATEQMKIVVDAEILGQIYADADAKNTGTGAGKISGNINLGVTGTPLVVGNNSGAGISPTALLLLISQCLDEQNVPESDRWVIVPSWLNQMLKNSDLKAAYLTGDNKSPLRNGRVGDVDRLTVYLSNLLTTVVDGGNNCTHIIGGQRHALGFATQLVENEMIKAESTFGYLGRGLQVYGHKTLKPEALVHAYARPNSAG